MGRDAYRRRMAHGQIRRRGVPPRNLETPRRETAGSPANPCSSNRSLQDLEAVVFSRLAGELRRVSLRGNRMAPARCPGKRFQTGVAAPRHRGSTRECALSENAQTTADVRGASRASARGAILAPSPRRLRRGAHVPGARDEADTRGYALCARASSGVFARTEQHVGQFHAGTRPESRRACISIRSHRSPRAPHLRERRSSLAGMGEGQGSDDTALGFPNIPYAVADR